MTHKSIPVQIAEAINRDDDNALCKLIIENPDQKNIHTFMAGQTWLGYAAQKGSLKSISVLISEGFDKNIGTKRDKYGPICSAAHNGHIEIVKYLLGGGAKLNTDTSVQNPLFSAIVGRSPDIVQLLLEAGIDSTVHYNSNTMKNKDAVAFALMRGEAECAKKLHYGTHREMSNKHKQLWKKQTVSLKKMHDSID